MTHKFKVGDRVQFKTWEEMEKEFGLRFSYNINLEPSFTDEMTYLCGSYATIIEILDNKKVLLDSFSETQHDNNQWAYTLDMLKPAEKDLASEDLKDCVGYSLEGIKNSLKGDKVILLDDRMLTLDEQIKYHEKKLTELKAQKEKEKWQFTEDEKVILRNLPEDINWIARCEDVILLRVFTDEPIKIGRLWEDNGYIYDMSEFAHLFQCIEWTDTEPCEFRKYI